MKKSTVADVPRQDGRSVVVTGTGGLGYETALVLAGKGGEVILAGRNSSKGAESVKRIKDLVPTANVGFESLDLASLASVEAFGNRLRDQRKSLDVLINNAAVMAPQRRETTSDGFELQLGTNYLGAFALTAHLLPLLRAGRDPRVVMVSSIADRNATIDFVHLQAEDRYRAMESYGQSKLAALIFALELQRRSDLAGWGLKSIAVHPGIARTELIPNGMGRFSLLGLFLTLVSPFSSQSAADGAWSLLFAATSPEAAGGAYYGPQGLGGVKGPVGLAQVSAAAKDLETARILWEVSEELTVVKFPF